MEPRKYRFNNSTLTIMFGDIMTSKSEVIVSSDNTGITMGGGLSACILRAGGESIRQDAKKKLPALLGDVVVSTAGNLEHQKYIFHCLTIDFKNGNDFYKGKLSNIDDINNYILQHSIDKCFRLLQALDINSIAFPCIGAGSAHIPITKVAEAMADAISKNLCSTQKPYQIELYLYDKYHIMQEIDYLDVFENFAIKSAMASYKAHIQTSQMESDTTDTTIAVTAIPKREEMKHKVFISYSRKDIATVDKVRKIMDKYNIPYWIDKKGIFSGENYKEVIVNAIEIAKVVLFFSSANSNASDNVYREISRAVKSRKTIIPIMLDDAPYAKSISYDISDINQIEYDNTEEFSNKLITSLSYSLEL